jgi:gas vesicle protein
MLNILKKVKRRRAADTRNKVIIFSAISAVISAVSAWFFSNEDNRKTVVKKAKQAGDQIQKTSNKAAQEAKKTAGKISEFAKKEAKLISEKIQKSTQKKSETKTLEEGQE